jgi:hypothetical protein
VTRDSMLRITIVALFLLSGISPSAGTPQPPGGSATSLVCDAALAPQSGPLGYRLRGDRCEGLYEQMAALGSMRPVSLTLQEVPVPESELRLSWPEPSSRTPVRVEAVAFKPNVYYRMNTVSAGGAYRWPTNVLQAIGVSDIQWGVVATADEIVNGTSQRVYLPVDLEPRSSATPRGRYVLKVASVEDLSAVFLTIVGPTTSGQAGARVVSDRRIAGPYHSSATPIRIPLDFSALDDGLYQVRVSATLSNRAGGTTLSFYLRHAR